MSSPLLDGFARRLALIGATAALAIGFGAIPAFASVAVSPAGPYSWSGEKITVSGTPAAGATHVALVLCNVSEGPSFWGTRCDIESGTPGFVTATQYENGVKIPIQRGPWQDYSFVTGKPVEGPNGSTCYSELLEEGDECAIVVSYYKAVEKGFEVLTPQASTEITFD